MYPATFETLEYRLRELLPEEYQNSYESVEPVSMGSAGLKYDGSGKVAWDEIWGSFCDLAMAGGPPHKGLLLESGSCADIDAQPDRYRAVVDEICRGVTMVTDLPAAPSPDPGWIRVSCHNEAMSGWLLRAIVMENVSTRMDGSSLDLPAGPGYRLEKEIKNVITVIAKTCHYWLGHMWRAQRHAVEELFAQMNAESPLVKPATSEDANGLASEIAAAILRETGLRSSTHRYVGWLGLECPNVRSAVWMMRMMVGSNVLTRREGFVLFVPVNPAIDPDGRLVIESVKRIHGFAAARHIL